MASSIYRKKHGGTVKIHDKAVVDHVVGDSENAKAEIENKCTAYKDMFDKESSKFSTKSESINECLPKVESKRSMTGQSRNSRSSSNLQDQSLKLQNWIDKKTIKELQERADTESLETKKLYSELMETEQTFVKKLDELLSHKDLVDLRRKELLYLQWSEEVYEPIRKKILQAIDGSEWSKLDRRKRELHKQFLEHVNKRGHVFLEDDDKEQYYAQALNDSRPAPIKIKTEALRDPLLTLGRKKAEEERTILRCMTGQHYTDEDIEKVKLPPLPLVPLGRHGVNSRKWLQMPLNNIESEIRQRRRNRMLGINTKSVIDFGAWSLAEFDAKITEQELQIPKKRIFAEKPPYGKPPAEVQKAPFIDPEEFADKIVNTNPFPAHIARLKAEAEEMREYYKYQQEQYERFLQEQPYYMEDQMTQQTSDQLQQIVTA